MTQAELTAQMMRLPASQRLALLDQAVTNMRKDGSSPDFMVRAAELVLDQLRQDAHSA